MAAYHRDWVEKNPERARAIAGRAALKAKERRKAYGKRWRELNRERNSQQKRDYYRANKAAIRQKYRAQYAANRLALLLKWGRGLNDADASALLAEHADGCVFCGSHERLELDHKMPKSRGGPNTRENLQWLCRLCNAAKGDMTTVEFITHIRKILKRAE